ncbi:tripartite tricarboxylate transporter TctB family protein [Pikeienuella sp. HZG-20]|uniref:tripartite tricarboxylate transporter TctB family protein n=1 Tax=Paludibacillus litoralis TaxID=3133267 RepID=UPI0030EE231C
MNRQAAFALFLIIVNAIYFAEALTLPRPFNLGEPGPAFLPLVLSLILFVSCGRILYKEMRGVPDDGDVDEAAEHGFRPRAAALVIATCGFILLFEPAGYWIATLAYTFVVAFLFERERTAAPGRALALSAVMALGITASGWLFFVTLFDLMLPAGSF